MQHIAPKRPSRAAAASLVKALQIPADVGDEWQKTPKDKVQRPKLKVGEKQISRSGMVRTSLQTLNMMLV